MDQRLLSAKYQTCLHVVLPATGHVVLPHTSSRQHCLTPTDTPVGHGASSLRLRADLYFAQTRGLVGRAQSSTPVVQTRGSPGTYEMRRRKRISLHRGPVPIAVGSGQYWAMDFVHDQLLNGRKFRVLTVIDK
jgi:hypothetical protein